eukprot:m.487481 g.487481  ORF g.487481 m.487481 type:complete len:217 (-) comp25040_c0_seq1:171-821(-)
MTDDVFSYAEYDEADGRDALGGHQYTMGAGDDTGYLESGDVTYDMAIDPAYKMVEPDEVLLEGLDNPVYDMGKGDAGYLAVQPDWLEDQWNLLACQPWFRGHQTRTEARRELTGQRPGSFTVRVSQSQPGHYAISAVQLHGQMEHMLILPSWAGKASGAPGNTRYRLGTMSRKLFNTVPKLIAYYIANPYIGTHYLRGAVEPEHQEGGYMMVSPDE